MRIRLPGESSSGTRTARLPPGRLSALGARSWCASARRACSGRCARGRGAPSSGHLAPPAAAVDADRVAVHPRRSRPPRAAVPDDLLDAHPPRERVLVAARSVASSTLTRRSAARRSRGLRASRCQSMARPSACRLKCRPESRSQRMIPQLDPRALRPSQACRASAPADRNGRRHTRQLSGAERDLFSRGPAGWPRFGPARRLRPASALAAAVQQLEQPSDQLRVALVVREHEQSRAWARSA